MVKSEKNSVIESRKKHFSENKSSGDYSYPEWSAPVIPPVSRKFGSYDLLVVGSFYNTHNFSLMLMLFLSLF